MTTVNGNGDGRSGFGLPRTERYPASADSSDAQRLAVLADDATIDLAAEREASGIDSVLSALDTSLIMGYLRRGHVVAVTRDDLVGQYVGHTAPKTREVLKRAMGGVLFIDEAYYLYRAENERDYGQESIEILLQAMENDRSDLVVILAGYADRMDSFFASNPGMSSRVAHHLEFGDYSLDELVAIGSLMLGRQRYRLSADAEVVFRDYLSRRRQAPRFANARSVRNALERARLRHANRLLSASGCRWGRDDLMRLEPADFLASRVFAGGPPARSQSAPG